MMAHVMAHVSHTLSSCYYQLRRMKADRLSLPLKSEIKVISLSVCDDTPRLL